MYYIYKLVFKETDKFYIGQTKDLDKRYESHWNSLLGGRHHNLHMQNWYRKHKPMFMGMVILNCFENKEDCNKEEVKLINETYKDNFNVSKKADGGDLISYHPYNDEIRKKIQQASKLLWSNPSHREKLKGVVAGSKNPNYKDGKTMIDRFCFVCGVKLKKVYELDKPIEDMLCISCRKKTHTGDKNHFYGKHHTVETKEKIRIARQKLTDTGYIPPYAKMVVAEGKIFKSCRLCAKHYNISDSLITYRIKKDKWDFHYYDEDLHSELPFADEAPVAI